MSKSRSGDSAVYKRPLSGGEAIDDDVEGHSMMTHASGGPKLHAAGGLQLHAAGGPKAACRSEAICNRRRRRRRGPRLKASRLTQLGDDDDVRRSQAGPKRSASGDDEDAEGHSMRASQASPKLHAAGGPKVHSRPQALRR